MDPSAPLNVLLVNRDNVDQLAKFSERRPGVVVVSTNPFAFAFEGAVVRIGNGEASRLLLAILSRRGIPLSRIEAEEVLWADRRDGGPESKVLDIRLQQVRAAALVLGCRIGNRHGVGWYAERMSASHLQAAE